jgi:Arc/MetJ family transcription regulator
MPTNLMIDDELLCEAQRLGKQRTKKATVNEALREYVARRRRNQAVDLFGAIEFDPQYDYKAGRRKR